MTRTKLLGALIILSAAVAAPVSAQEAGKRGQAVRYGMETQSIPRGAYNQVNEPISTAVRKRDRFDPVNSGNVEKDPQITGGEDITLRPAGG
jgi:hypothetical protein